MLPCTASARLVRWSSAAPETYYSMALSCRLKAGTAKAAKASRAGPRGARRSASCKQSLLSERHNVVSEENSRIFKM